MGRGFLKAGWGQEYSYYPQFLLRNDKDTKQLLDADKSMTADWKDAREK